ncbi:MAG TPA: hypothetical protein VIL46_00645 [Gemmataceae bacterium]
MSRDEITQRLDSRLFRPFRIVMTDGSSFEVRRQGQIMAGRRSAVLGISTDPGRPWFDRFAYVDYLHIVRLEDLEEGPPPHAANGAARPE